MTPPRNKKRRPPVERLVMYVRVQESEHRDIAEIAEARGYPHTIASVAAEMITRGLAAWQSDTTKETT